MLIKFLVIFLVIIVLLDDFLFVMIIKIFCVFGLMVLFLVKIILVVCNVLFSVEFLGMFLVEFIFFISLLGFVYLLENCRMIEGLLLYNIIVKWI